MHIDADLGPAGSRLAADNGPAAVAKGYGTEAGQTQTGTRRRAMTPIGTVGKHCVDFFIALLGGVCLLPLLALVAVLIKLDSPGPVFFRQKRAGCNGRLFEIFKFRTMVQGAYHMGSRLTVKRDPRITRLGQLLRWSKIDELPQLLNVLRGEMSLIGPRPEDPYFEKSYSLEQRRALLVRPGIVGPSQILGRDEIEDYPEGIKDTERYYIEHILPPKLQRDVDYVDHATFWSDMRLLVKGVWITVRGAFRAKYLWRRRRRIALMGVDLVLAVLAYLLAFLIRFEWQWPTAEYVWQTLALIVLLRSPLLLYFGAYHGIVSYFGLWDLVALFKAVSVGSIAIAALTYLGGSQEHPRSVFVLDWALLLFMLASTRYALRAWTRRHPRGRVRNREKAIIVGAGNGGEQISRALTEDPTSSYIPVGFIDESHERWGSRIRGVKVLGGACELRLALSANGVRVVFVCLSDLSGSVIEEVRQVCVAAGVECRMVPAFSELLNTESFTIERSGLHAATGGAK
jgi:lipopolysaccharide/colanic/teichoic acid biosynthesis glycosyltransferase